MCGISSQGLTPQGFTRVVSTFFDFMLVPAWQGTRGGGAAVLDRARGASRGVKQEQRRQR